MGSSPPTFIYALDSQQLPDPFATQETGYTPRARTPSTASDPTASTASDSHDSQQTGSGTEEHTGMTRPRHVPPGLFALLSTYISGDVTPSDIFGPEPAKE